ncbi:MAG: hypothetical protein H0T84_01460 [Tatlockia sp.]|nr:hypothetical protein [Tatlockia sp.]
MQTRKEKNSQEPLSITLFRSDGSTTVFPECTKSTSGGSKQIINLNDKEVIAQVGNFENTKAYIQSEVDFSNRLRAIGLRAQHYQMAEILGENDTRIPVLIMPAFQFLVEQGQQVRDQKNSESSAGESLVFGSLDNLVSEAHWRKILTPLAEDIVLYLINGFNFPGDSWNSVIEDTAETPDRKAQTDSLLFSDLAQEIHFYFFDFGSRIISDQKFIYNFFDVYGEISEETIAWQVTNMKDQVLSLIFHTSPNTQEYNHLSSIKESHYKPVFEEVWKDISAMVVNKIKKHLENFSDEERLDNFTAESTRTNIFYFRKMRSDSEESLGEIEAMRALRLNAYKFEEHKEIPKELLEPKISTFIEDLGKQHETSSEDQVESIQNTFNASQTITIMSNLDILGYVLIAVGAGLLIAGFSVATAGLFLPAFGALTSTLIIVATLIVTGTSSAVAGAYAQNPNLFFAPPSIDVMENEQLICDSSLR